MFQANACRDTRWLHSRTLQEGFQVRDGHSNCSASKSQAVVGEFALLTKRVDQGAATFQTLGNFLSGEQRRVV